MTEEPRRPFFEGLLPDEAKLQVTRQSRLQRWSTAFARLFKRLRKFLKKRNTKARRARFSHDYTAIRDVRGWRATCETSEMKRSQLRKFNETLH